MTFPTPHELLVRRYQPGTVDSFGNATVGWSEPSPWLVHSVEQLTAADPRQPNRDSIVWSHVVLAPADSAVPGERDQVFLDGAWRDVDGVPKDWTRGPWVNPAAGVEVALRKVEG